VDYDGAFPIEGAKEVATLMTRYVTRALREVEPPARPAPGAAPGPAPGQVRLRVAPGGRRLVADAGLRPAGGPAPQLGHA
jgi:hypothetical protein